MLHNQKQITMKKQIFLLIAVLGFMFTSCVKDTPIEEEIKTEGEVVVPVDDNLTTSDLYDEVLVNQTDGSFEINSDLHYLSEYMLYSSEVTSTKSTGLKSAMGGDTVYYYLGYDSINNIPGNLVIQIDITTINCEDFVGIDIFVSPNGTPGEDNSAYSYTGCDVVDVIVGDTTVIVIDSTDALLMNYMLVEVFGENSEYIGFVDYQVNSYDSIIHLTETIYQFDNKGNNVDTSNVDSMEIGELLSEVMYNKKYEIKGSNIEIVPDSTIQLSAQFKSTNASSNTTKFNVLNFEKTGKYFKFKLKDKDNKDIGSDTYYFFDMTKGELAELLSGNSDKADYTDIKSLRKLHKFAVKNKLSKTIESDIFTVIAE